MSKYTDQHYIHCLTWRKLSNSCSLCIKGKYNVGEWLGHPLNSDHAVISLAMNFLPPLLQCPQNVHKETINLVNQKLGQISP